MTKFVENCSYWITISTGLVCLSDFQQCCICGKISRKGSVLLRGAGNGKEWESSCVSGWLRLRFTGETGLERQQGREEEALTCTVLLAE